MPYPLELPRMRRAVVPLVRPRHSVIQKLVPRLLPCLAAVVRTLNDLPKPAAGLRRIQPVRVHRRSLEVVDLPARKVRPCDLPLFPLSIRRQHKSTLARANQQPHLTHRSPSLASFLICLSLQPAIFEPMYHQRQTLIKVASASSLRHVKPTYRNQGVLSVSREYPEFLRTTSTKLLSSRRMQRLFWTMARFS